MTTANFGMKPRRSIAPLRTRATLSLMAAAIALHSAEFKKVGFEGSFMPGTPLQYDRFAHNWELASLVHAMRDLLKSP
jgi:hypothetical protein